MMDDLREQIARAIYEADGGKGWHLHEQVYLRMADAVLDIMRPYLRSAPTLNQHPPVTGIAKDG